ncbi:hypothetical protein FKM82_011838 [Ascaphus truei]
MGCRTSRMCCPRAWNKKRPKAKQLEQISQELSDLTAKCHGRNEELQKRKDHEREIGDILQKHQEEKTTLAEAHKAEMETQARELLAQARRDADTEVLKRLSEQATAMKTELEEKCAELQRSYDQEKTSLTETYQKLTTSLQETVEELNSQLASFREKMKRVEESVLNQDYKRHVQDHGSPGQFWEQELQSLHFVIEMKSELIRDQDKRLLRLETTMDRNGVLEERVRSLQQEREALRVQTQNQAAVTIASSHRLLFPSPAAVCPRSC